MKYKIKYFLTGGENIDNSALLYNKKYIGSYDQTNFFETYQNIEYFSVNPNESLSTEAYFLNINYNNILTTMFNGGNLEKNRHMVQPFNSKYSNQCMYISIYDYLFLKKRIINVSFNQFRINNEIFTDNNREWDNNNKSHENNIIHLCNEYNLDIRIWYKTENKNLATYIPEGENMTKITTEHNGKYLIAPMLRYGPGNPNIVNIAYIDAPRHFELILGGSFFEPLLTKEQFYALPIEYTKYISNKIHTTYHSKLEFKMEQPSTLKIINEYGVGKNKNYKTFNDLYDKDRLYKDYFCNHKNVYENKERERQEREQQELLKRERERQELLEKQQQEQQQQPEQQQPEQEDDDFFNYENNELIEEFQSWYCDDENYDGNDINDYNYYLIHTWQNWRDNYCDSDNDNTNMSDWYDENYEIFPPLTFLDEYHEYYNNN